VKERRTFEGVEGVLGTESVLLAGCKLPFAEGSGLNGVVGVAGVVGVFGGKLRVAGDPGVLGVCGGGPTWKLGTGIFERSLPFFP
jgi:hypothetical protein